MDETQSKIISKSFTKLEVWIYKLAKAAIE